MERLPELGRSIPDTAGPTYTIYGDLLRSTDNATRIRSASRLEFAYGPHERHRLDVYEPSGDQVKDNSPILIFVHGGGFISGDKRLPEVSGDIAYANLGEFFSRRFGFTTLLINYRLIPHGAVYPSGPDDLDLVLRWVEKNYAERKTLYLLGNSAGGVHVASWLWGQSYTEHRNQLIGNAGLGLRIRGVGLLGVPFQLDPEGPMKPLLSLHYGGPDVIRANEPTQLMTSATQGLSSTEVSNWPPTSVMICELDPEDDIKGVGRDFAEAWRSRGGRGNFVEIPGHNHISPVVSLGTGLDSEEQWGVEFGQWLIQQDSESQAC